MAAQNYYKTTSEGELTETQSVETRGATDDEQTNRRGTMENTDYTHREGTEEIRNGSDETGQRGRKTEYTDTGHKTAKVKQEMRDRHGDADLTRRHG